MVVVNGTTRAPKSVLHYDLDLEFCLYPFLFPNKVVLRPKFTVTSVCNTGETGDIYTQLAQAYPSR